MKILICVAMLSVVMFTSTSYASDATNTPTISGNLDVKIEATDSEVLGVGTPEKVRIFNCYNGNGDDFDAESARVSNWLTEHKGKIRLTSKPDVGVQANGNVVVIVYHYVELPPEKPIK